MAAAEQCGYSGTYLAASEKNVYEEEYVLVFFWKYSAMGEAGESGSPCRLGIRSSRYTRLPCSISPRRTFTGCDSPTPQETRKRQPLCFALRLTACFTAFFAYGKVRSTALMPVSKNKLPGTGHAQLPDGEWKT